MYIIECAQDGCAKLRIEEGYRYCYALTAPTWDEEEGLHTGIWLVVVFTVHDKPDNLMAHFSYDLVKKCKGKVKLGLRVYEALDIEDVWRWCPALAHEYRSPHLLIVKEGEVVWQFTGLPNYAVLREVMREALGK